MRSACNHVAADELLSTIPYLHCLMPRSTRDAVQTPISLRPLHPGTALHQHRNGDKLDTREIARAARPVPLALAVDELLNNILIYIA